MLKENHSLAGLILAVLLLLMGCSARHPVTRDTVPASRPEVEILSGHTALIRTAECDISVLRLTEKQWSFFQETYRGTFQRSGSFLPYPPGELFFIIIANSSEHNLTDITTSCAADKISYPMLKPAELSERYRSDSDISALCEQLFTVRRLMSFEYDLEKIELAEDTILQPFPFVLPLDRICFVAASPPIPTDIRAFTVTVSYSCSSLKKNVDFRFTRLEHREEE